eukprot:CAMPEP_0197700652 /NCGR_PEP_ID=MMETSP1338-20131121/122238_1 /TAXON_ID=43686 ORGANISM="Pelagodinium beii, Strain RCC1491" /NCGR_SAMPLE_ID=MMETSP1338 /ASSEMBLY_ACC=CAM_ASM_000754 /LENGTH=215 /DNA_ID=CAMNT_0043284287 /DNA_START=33 /DNA_END=677 /DNA_ORIENTATION=-
MPLDLNPRQEPRKWACYQEALSSLPGGETLHPDVEVSHFVGGPCDKHKVAAVLVKAPEVPEGSHVHNKLLCGLSAAQMLSKARAEREQSGEPPRKRLRGKTRPASEPPRKPVSVEVFWGTAGWSRCQLMGELASGSWGLCTASIPEIICIPRAELYETLYPRLVFASKSEMSEDYSRDDGDIDPDQFDEEGGEEEDAEDPPSFTVMRVVAVFGVK